MLEQFLRSRFLRSTATLATGTVISQALSVLASPLLTRVYSPSDFGFLAVFSSMTVTGAAVVMGTYELAIVPAKTVADAERLFRLSLLLLLGSTVLLTAATVTRIVPTVWLASALNVQPYGRWLQLVPLGILAAGSVNLLSYWHNRQEGYSSIAASRVLKAAVAVVLKFLFSFFNAGLAVGGAIGEIIGVLPLLRNLPKELRQCSGDSAATARSHRDFPCFMLPNVFFNTLTYYVPSLILSASFSPASAGSYALACSTMGMPAVIIGGAIGQVFNKEFAARHHQMGAVAARRLLMKTWLLLFATGILPFLLTMIFGPNLFSLVFGDQWREAGVVASFLSPMFFAGYLTSPTSGTFVALGLQRYAFVFGLSAFVYTSLIYSVCGIYGLFHWALIAHSAVYALHCVVYNSIVFRKTS